MKPLMYGYLRVGGDASDEDVARVRRELTGYAERERFTIAEIFAEGPDLPGAAFNGLHQAIQDTETKDIVVPRLSHFCPLLGLAAARKAIIEQMLGVHVWVIQP